jgi:hypothetical protein
MRLKQPKNTDFHFHLVAEGKNAWSYVWTALQACAFKLSVVLTEAD